MCAAEYPTTMLVRSVRHHEKIRYKKQEVFLSEVLRGESVGFLATDEHLLRPVSHRPFRQS